MYLVAFRNGQWSVVWRYSNGEQHFVTSYSDKDTAEAAAKRMNAA